MPSAANIWILLKIVFTAIGQYLIFFKIPSYFLKSFFAGGKLQAAGTYIAADYSFFALYL